MKIEDAKSKLARTALLMFEANGTSTLDGDATLALIDEIYADFEKEQANLRYQLIHQREPKYCEFFSSLTSKEVEDSISKIRLACSEKTNLNH